MDGVRNASIVSANVAAADRVEPPGKFREQPAGTTVKIRWTVDDLRRMVKAASSQPTKQKTEGTSAPY
jgi:hypothetical protein